MTNLFKKYIFIFSLVVISSFSFNFVFADSSTCNCSGTAAACVVTDGSMTVTTNLCNNANPGNRSCICTSNSASTNNKRGTGGLVPCINDCGVSDLLGDSSDYSKAPPIWTSLLRTALGVSGILILLLFIWGGVQMIISQGDKAKIKKAQDIMKNSIIGLVIVFFAYTVVKFIVIALVDGSNWKIFFGGGS